jgi:hypothetical protein
MAAVILLATIALATIEQHRRAAGIPPGTGDSAVELRSVGFSSRVLAEVPVDLVWLALVPALLATFATSARGVTNPRLFCSFAVPLGLFYAAYALWYVPSRPVLSGDSIGYAQALTTGTYSTFRNSGYASFLIVVGKVFGLYVLPTIQILLQIVAVLGSIWIVGSAYGWTWAGIALLLLFCLQGNTAEYALGVWTEALFAAGLALFAAALAAGARRPAKWILAVGGVGLAVTTLVKPVGVVLIAPGILLVRFLPRRTWVRSAAILVVPAISVHGAMAAHSYVRTGRLTPEDVAGYSLIGHVGWMLSGEAPGHPGAADALRQAVEPVLARRPPDLRSIRSQSDLDRYVDYTVQEYNTLLWRTIVPASARFVSSQTEANATYLSLGLTSIARRPADYAGHVAAHFYGLWRDLGRLADLPTASANWRIFLSTIPDAERAYHEGFFRGHLPPYPDRPRLSALAEQQSMLPLAFGVLWRAATWLRARRPEPLESSTIALGILALGLSILYVVPGRLTWTYRSEIMLALTLNAYFLGHALFQVSLQRYAGVALMPAAFLAAGCISTTWRTLRGRFAANPGTVPAPCTGSSFPSLRGARGRMRMRRSPDMPFGPRGTGASAGR